MSGGLMQLVAYGAQDVYLTGSPQISFFKSAYRRHTNFAMQMCKVTALINVSLIQRYGLFPDLTGNLAVRFQRCIAMNECALPVFSIIGYPSVDCSWCHTEIYCYT